MVEVQVFLSYKWEDKKFSNDLKSCLKNPNNKYQHTPLTERNDYRKKGKTEIRNYLKNIITKSETLICLIGNNTHSSLWVGYELEVANSQKKKIVPVRIRGTGGGPPKLIKERNLEIIKWDSQKINNILSQK